MTAGRSGEGNAASPRYYIETWGCQMNVHDSEKLAGSLASMGYLPAATGDEADLLLLNTCAIRGKAAEKVFSRLGQLRLLKHRRPGMLIGVTGCVASMEGETIFRRAPHVDIVMGPRGIMNLPDLLDAARARRRAVDVAHHQESILYPWENARRGDGPRAYITIIEGCNKACTYCIVPMTRGPEASRPLEQVIEEVRGLTERGYREIEFLGQTVNAYRDPGGRTLADLLRAADRVEGVARLRFTTSHPLHMTRDLMQAMASCEHVIRFLHLPVQSGSNGVLARMKRGYTREGYLEKVRMLRQLIPDVALSTDIIVGFPGETDADFEATLDLVEEARFDSLYSFIYSPRPGTEAEHWTGENSFEINARRLARLQQRQSEIQLEKHRRWVGRVVEVLVEGKAKAGSGLMTGRTPTGHIVNFPADGFRVGDLLRLTVTGAGPNSLKGAREKAFS